jgi:hypothetical protein
MRTIDRVNSGHGFNTADAPSPLACRSSAVGTPRASRSRSSPHPTPLAAEVAAARQQQPSMSRTLRPVNTRQTHAQRSAAPRSEGFPPAAERTEWSGSTAPAARAVAGSSTPRGHSSGFIPHPTTSQSTQACAHIVGLVALDIAASGKNRRVPLKCRNRRRQAQQRGRRQRLTHREAPSPRVFLQA